MKNITKFLLPAITVLAPTLAFASLACSQEGVCDSKKALAECRARLTAEGEDFATLKALASAYQRDQNPEAAVETFLRALALCPKLNGGDDENIVYEEGLNLYLSGGNPRETAVKILDLYGPSQEFGSSPMRFLIAGAYGNIHRFEEFFEQFSLAYPYHSDHWLAYKGKASLHLWLLPRQRDDASKEIHRQEALKLADEAIARYPKDTALYMWKIMLADKQERAAAVAASIKKIIDEDIQVPRSEIAFFVQQAAAVKEWEVGQRFLNKAKGWYSLSRTITAAQNYLDNQKKQ